MRANNESRLEKLLTHCSEAPPPGVRGLSSKGKQVSMEISLRYRNSQGFLTGLIGLRSERSSP